jgi:RES domain-containing protein
MRLWRISNYADLSGDGGLRAGGRWHEKGCPVVYLAENAPLALLEVLVHLEIDPADLPTTYRLLEIEAPDSVSVEEITRSELDKNAPGWMTDSNAARSYTKAWFSTRRTALLRVPSVILPYSHNYLLNPLHPDAAQAKIVEVTVADFDQRLFPSPLR